MSGPPTARFGRPSPAPYRRDALYGEGAAGANPGAEQRVECHTTRCAHAYDAPRVHPRRLPARDDVRQFDVDVGLVDPSIVDQPAEIRALRALKPVGYDETHRAALAPDEQIVGEFDRVAEP